MKEFVLLFRQPSFDYSSASPAEMQAITKRWKEWAGGSPRRDTWRAPAPGLRWKGKSLKPAE